MKAQNTGLIIKLKKILSILVIASMIVMFLPVTAGTAEAETASQSLMTDDVPTIYETLDESGFRHPGIGLTKETLVNLQVQIRANKEPWKTYFNQMAMSTDPWGGPIAAKSVSSRFSEGCWCSQGYNEKFIWDGLTAYTQALMYVITGDEVYRANTMYIIRKWEQKNPADYAYFNDAHIHTGVPLYRMVTAAEIMRYTSTQTPELAWTDKDTADFTNNLIVPVTETFNHTNDRFMNQHLYPLMGAISGYIFTGNDERYHEAVEWFTVNKAAVDQHINGSIMRLFRLVDTNAATGEKVDHPQVQITEMGRDQAHSTGDVINAAIISRLLQAQGTKVDPVEGTVSTAADAVSTYDFLGKRILAGTDYFARYMIGYDTPWIPTEARMREDGSPVIYQVLSTEYRGRIGGNAYDLYYYYKYEQGLDMEQVAPYYTEMFNKRTDYYWASRDSGGEYWLYIPKAAEAEGTANLPKVNPNPNWKEIEDRFTNLDGNSIAMQEGETSFVRIQATESGSKIALVESGSGASVLGYKIRTNGSAKLAAFGETITLPDTQGQWRYVYYEGRGIGTLEYFSIIGNGTTVDIDHIHVNAAHDLTPPVFNEGNTALNLFTYVGSEAALHADFSATDAGSSDVVTYRIVNSPEGAVFDTGTGIFDWNPTFAGTYAFVVEASDGMTVSTRDVTVTVANDRQSAMDAVIAPYDANTDYIWATLDTYKQAYNDTMGVMSTATDADFYQKLAALYDAVQGLQLTTPLLYDGSIHYEGMFLSSDFNSKTYLDNVTSTFGRGVDMDMGPQFRVSASAFGIQARAGFPERGGGIAMYGSNDKENWTRLTPGVTPVSAAMHTLEVSPELHNEPFRFLKIQMIQKPYDAPFTELSEFRIFGKRHEIINKIASVSIGSDQVFGGRIVIGDTAKLTFRSTEAIQNVNATIQGQPAIVHSVDGLNWIAEAVMNPGTTPGNVTFKLLYRTAEGIDAPETMFVTDGSRLILVDDSDVIPNVTSIAAVTDSYGRSPADAIATANVLFDNNPTSSTDYRLNGSGAGSWVQFDFGQGGYAELNYVELLARQDGYYTRINGTVIQGSNDNTTWKTISSSAVSTKDWQILSMNDNQPYRYIRIINGNAWFGNMAEVRLHGSAKVLTKINSVSISSEQAILNRIKPGDIVNLAFTSMEPINTVNVKIQGQDATVISDDQINWTAKALMEANAAPGPVNFHIHYKTSEGLDAPVKASTTDGSSLTLADESDLIRGVTSITDVTDSNGRSPADAIAAANALFDGNPGSVTDYRLNGSGAGSWVQFDFRSAQVQLKAVELLARQDGYYTRIKGAVIQGSNDNTNWMTISTSAASTKDWQILSIMDRTPYRYIRIYNGNSWFGNVAEVRFLGGLGYDAAYLDSIIPAADSYTKGSYYLYQQKVNVLKVELASPDADQLAILNELLQASSILVPKTTITPSMVEANTPSWDGKLSAATNGWRAFDGDANTSPDTKTASGWVDVDLGEGNAITVDGIKFIPRSGNITRMNGALIQGSNDGVNFNTLHTIQGVSGLQWYTQAIHNNTAHRYLRYYTANGYANVGELHFLSVDRTLLAFLLNQAGQVVAEPYTASSYAALQTAVVKAMSVDADAQSSQMDVDLAADSLKTALDGLIYKITVSLDPVEPNGSNGWYTTPVTVSLSTYSRLEYSLDGGATWDGYKEALKFGQDGKHTVAYRSRNEAGIAGDVQTISVHVDRTAPTITVTGLENATYANSTDIMPIIALGDLLSGVNSSKTTVTLDTYGIQGGNGIPLFSLPLGPHTLTVTAVDLAGNTGSQTVVFQTTASIESMQALVTRFTDAQWIDGEHIWIDNKGIAKSLQSKLAANELAAFVNQVKALRGKHMTEKAAEYMLRDAEHLLQHSQ